MPRTELTRMGIAFAVALVATSYLAIDAGVVDVNSGAIAKRIETARASIVDAATGRTLPVLSVQAWAPRGHQSLALEHCLAID